MTRKEINMKLFLASILLAASACACDDVSSTQSVSQTPPVVIQPTKEVIYGITSDDAYHSKEIVDSISKMSRKITMRLVYDEKVKATEYVASTKEVHKVAFVMGELLDSFYVGKETLASYRARASEYLAAMGDNVDIWEIGNEINGEWLGTTANVVAKMQGAYDVMKAKQKRVALTLYYNQGCYDDKANEMFTWAAANIPQNMKNGLDYVLVSYYEDDCSGLKPDWPTVFHKLALMFPNSKVGFGEVGTKIALKKNKQIILSAQDNKAEYIKRYYSMTINEPNYIGGYFWWYGYQDLIPATNPLWSVFNNAIGAK